MDPHDVLNLPRTGYTINQLKFNYRALAKQLHPDKRRVSPEEATQLFQVLTDAYRKLSEELDKQHIDRTFFELRDSSRRSAPPPPSSTSVASHQHQHQRDDNPQPVVVVASSQSQRFNVEKFNRVFSENRLEDPVFDAGYDKWMKETDPEIANKTGGKNLIRYEEPQPMILVNKNTTAYSELGTTHVDDFSRNETARHGLQYTDYRVAHTTTKLATDEEIRMAEERANKELRSVDVLKKHRSSYTMTDSDARKEEQRAREKDEAERRRVAALSAYEKTLEQFEQRTKFLLR